MIASKKIVNMEYNSKKTYTPINESRKRTSAIFNPNILDDNDDIIGLDSELNDINENYENDDDEDLNYATNSKKRKSIIINENSNNKTSLSDSVRPPLSSQNLSNEKNKKHEDMIRKKNNLACTIDRICEYAQVLMHCLLYKINYYNKKIHFEKYIKYNIIVYKCKSEIVCEYITNCVESMRLILYSQYNLDNYEDIKNENNKLFSIGLAILKSIPTDEQSESNSPNLLIKRYTLQIEPMNLINYDSDDDDELNIENNSENNYVVARESDEDADQTESSITNKQEWLFRDSLLKCLYTQEVQYPTNFKWQIHLRTSTKQMSSLCRKEDLFKLFAWRQCDSEEITSETNKKSEAESNQISVKPIKTMEDFNRNTNLRMQLFIEKPLVSKRNRALNSIKSTQQLINNRKFLRKNVS